MESIKELIKKLEGEYDYSVDLLSTLDCGDDEYNRVSKHVADVMQELGKLYEILANLEQSKDSMAMKEKEIRETSSETEKNLKNAKKDRIWNGVLTAVKIGCEVAVPIFTAIICWDIEKDGTIRSRVFPSGKFKI